MKDREEQFCTALYEKYSRELYSDLRRKEPTFSREDLEDILQNVWLEAGKHVTDLRRMKPEERKYWLLHVCKSRSIDFARKRNRERELMERMQKEVQKLSCGDTDWKHIESEEILERVWKHLNPKERELVHKIYLRETGEAKEISLTNAEHCRLYAIRRKYKMWSKK